MRIRRTTPRAWPMPTRWPPSTPARAELIRIQIERFRREEAVGALVRNPGERERILLTCHGATWAREVAPYTRPWGGTGNVFPAWDFDRGFVAAVGASATVVADKDCPLPRLAPIEHLSLTGPGPFTAALTAPWLAQIRSLTATHLELGDDDAIALAQRGHLDRWSPGRSHVTWTRATNDSPIITYRGNRRHRSVHSGHSGRPSGVCVLTKNTPQRALIAVPFTTLPAMCSRWE